MNLRLICLALAATVSSVACHSISLQSERTELRASLETSFRSLDADADRSISAAEWESALRTKLSNSSDRSLTANATLLLEANREQFRRMDHDADGRLSLEEFVSGPFRIFDCLDRNANGQVSPEEETTASPACAPDEASNEAAE